MTGEGPEAFCAGGDQKIRGDAGYVDPRTDTPRLNVLDFQRQMRTCPKPIIAMVAGYAIGGGHVLHLMADITIAADNAVFGQTGPRVGSFDGGYGAAYMARIVGQKKAREIWFLCRKYDAQQALEMGLVNTVVPLERLEEETVQWCREILANSPTAIRCLKAAMNADCDGQAGLQELAGNATMLFYMTEEGQEGRNAFNEKKSARLLEVSKISLGAAAATPQIGALSHHARTDFRERWRFPRIRAERGAGCVVGSRPGRRRFPRPVRPCSSARAMAVGDSGFHAPAAFCCLLGALLIQVATNYANDYGDYIRGADTDERLGPVRATGAGLVTPAAMKRATGIAFAMALLPGLYIVYRGGWPFVLVGLLSISCGLLYTFGPVPFGYTGLADVVVLVFFGPVAVGGTYYVQALHIDWRVLVAGLAPGLFSVAILTVNNLRDIDTDRRAGKKTLAVRFGRTFARV